MQKSGVGARLLATFGLALGLPLIAISIPSHSQSVKTLKTNDEEMRRTMVVISRQLGVECTTCHNTKNFSLADKVEFRVAKEHMRLTQVLIDNGMDGKNKRPKADCFMCHRGQLRPDYQEKFDPMTMDKEKTKAPAPSDSFDSE